jgi:predicted hotdog family 3-hydroxylacyl-ACP dehydratase
MEESIPASLCDVTLEDLIPHRDAMLLVGRILSVDDASAVTESVVAGTWPMAGPAGVPPLILVELAAQTAGVFNGWERVRVLGRDSDKSGWLVGVKRAEFFVDTLPYGMQVTVRSENTLAFDKFREVVSRVHHRQDLLAEVVLQVYQA